MSPPADEPTSVPERAGDAEEELGAMTETLDPEDLSTLEALEEAGDVETLLTLAAAYESGTDEIAVDPARAVIAHEAASRLGDHTASYWLARQAFGEGIAAEHLERGVRFLRLAADGGHIEGRVFLGNLYELGVHYEHDPSKADLWYRSAARAAEVDHEYGSADWSVAMAQLGCVRSIVPLLEDTSVPTKHRLVYLRLVKNVGYSLFLAQHKAVDARDHAGKEARLLEQAEEEKSADAELIGGPRAKSSPAPAAGAEPGGEAQQSGGLSFARIMSVLAIAGGAAYGGLYLHQLGEVLLADPIHQAAAAGVGALLLAILVLGVKKTVAVSD